MDGSVWGPALSAERKEVRSHTTVYCKLGVAEHSDHGTTYTHTGGDTLGVSVWVLGQCIGDLNVEYCFIFLTLT